jgi:hypothetical protein
MTRGHIQKGTVLLSGFPIGALLISLALPQSNLPMPLDATVPSQKPDVEVVAQKTADAPNAKLDIGNSPEAFEFGSGARTTQELDLEWQTWTGANSSMAINDIVVKEELKLTTVLTEFQDLSKNPLRVLNVFATQADLPERTDSVTFFNREVDGIEERNLRAGLIVPHRLIANPEGLQVSMMDRSYYSVQLRQSVLKRPYDLREPHAQAEFTIANETDFNPLLAILTDARSRQADHTFSVQAEARETDFGTLVIELLIREIDSLQTQRIALIYE